MVLLVQGLLFLYAVLIIVYPLCSILKRALFSRYSCHETFAVAFDTFAARGCFVQADGIALSSNQGWVDSRRVFAQFHESLPPPEILAKPCRKPRARPGNLTLISVESAFKADSRVDMLGFVSCPQSYFCLVSATPARGAWDVRKFSYFSSRPRYPNALHGQIHDLRAKGVYHLVLRGPLAGRVTFRAILYHQDLVYSLPAQPHTLRPKRLHEAQDCEITLGSGVPDGILSIVPE